MSKSIPTTGEIRHYWSVRGMGRASRRAERAAECNRWVSEHDRKVIREFINQQVKYVRNVMANEETE